MTFPQGDGEKLSQLIEKLLDDPDSAAPYRLEIPAHLETLQLDRVTDRYLEAFEKLYALQAGEGMSRRKAVQRAFEELNAI